MFASICFGFFDTDALRRHEIAVVQPLDLERVAQLFSESGSVQSDNGSVDGQVFLIHPEGFVESTCVIASQKVIDFLSRFVHDTGCEITVPQFGGRLSLEALAANYEKLAEIYATTNPRVEKPTPETQVA